MRKTGRIILASFILTGVLSCNGRTKIEKKTQDKNEDVPLFKSVNFNYNTTDLVLPEGFSYQILFMEGDSVLTTDGDSSYMSAAKGKHDFVSFIPIDNNNQHGYLYISHETRTKNPSLGDGGGGTVLEIQWTNNEWSLIGPKRNIDFKQVGGTINNCGGTLTPTGFVLTAEEMAPDNNREIQEYISDLSSVNSHPRNENYGWMVLVDPKNAVGIKKVTNFGRYIHEDAHCTADGKTVYLTDDNCPAVFFKFECAEPNNYDQGQLYAYQQLDNGKSGQWLSLPMDYESLKKIRNVAIKMGATMFVRQEWVDGANGKIYITETGTDDFDLTEYIEMGGTVPHYLESLQYESNKYKDPYGRVLVFDPSNNTMEPFIEGGPLKDGGIFSNPDGLHVTSIHNKTYLIINEDKIGLDQGRVDSTALKNGDYYNNIYFFDLSKPADRNNLMRFAVGPKGCETTGSWFNAETNTFFFSIQSPDKSNPAPFNKSCTVAVSGFK